MKVKRYGPQIEEMKRQGSTRKEIAAAKIELIGLKAVELLRDRCAGDIGWLGDELGDLMLYVFWSKFWEHRKYSVNSICRPMEIYRRGAVEFIYPQLEESYSYLMIGADNVLISERRLLHLSSVAWR